SRVSFSGSAIATKATQRARLTARALCEQPTEADAEHDPAAEIHQRTDQKRECEDARAEQRARSQRTERVREAPHRETRTDGGRTLFRDRRRHEQRLMEWPREVREEPADDEE